MFRAKNFYDLTGVRFHRLTVVRDCYVPGHRGAKWECLCDCGKTVLTTGSLLKRGKVKSCGCYRADFRKTHGLSKTREYKMWVGLRWRAKRDGRDFNLDPSDIAIPDRCPVFGVPFDTGVGQSPYVPSVDRIDSSKGYVKGNIAIISWRANLLKNDATYEEVMQLAAWLKQVSGPA